jgi:hypothetical protein
MTTDATAQDTRTPLLPAALRPAANRLVWELLAVLGVTLVFVGLGIDAWRHETAPSEETLLSFSNPGHAIAGAGLVLLTGSVLVMMSLSCARAVSVSRATAVRLALVGASWTAVCGTGIGALVYLASTDASVGHSHESSVAKDHPHTATTGGHQRDHGRHPTFTQFQTLSVDALASAAPGATLDPSEGAALRSQLLATHVGVASLDSIDRALTAGYEPASVDTEGMGAHYLNMQFLSDGVFDPLRPEGLLFSRVDESEPKLVGVWFLQLPGSGGSTVTSPPEGFASDLDLWHGHDGICYVGLEAVSEDVAQESCEERGGLYIGDQRWMLHVWVTPAGSENPDGVFAYLNPELSERQVEAVPVGVRDFVIPQSDADGAASSFVGPLEAVVAALPEGALPGGGTDASARVRMVALASEADVRIATGDVAGARSVLEQLRDGLSGCEVPLVTATWITDCEKRTEALKAVEDALRRLGG